MSSKKKFFVVVLAIVMFVGGLIVGQKSVAEIDLTEYSNPGLSGFHTPESGSLLLSFRNGLAKVGKPGEMYHIGTNGKPAYDARYYYVGSFLDPDSAVAWGGSIYRGDLNAFHIDRNGNPLYEERYDTVSSFRKELALVSLNGEYFHITKNGEPAYVARYEWATSVWLNNGFLVRAYKDGQCLRIDARTGEVKEELELDRCPPSLTEK